MTVLSRFAGAALLAAACLGFGRRLLHLLQLESYQLPGYFRSVRRGLPGTLLPALPAAAVCCLLGLAGVPPLLLSAALAGAGGLFWLQAGRRKEKKPFQMTDRVKRFLAIHAAVGFLAALLAGLAGAAWALLVPGAEALVLALSACAERPVEKHIQGQFLDDARARLARMPGLIRIGITGSYGKTSTKFLLRDILSVRWNVLATPGSFNTTMGVTRVIREMLTPAHQVFIAEMGARHPGDVRELAELVRPTVGILTSIGEQHLDTFGSVENVRKTKYELMEALPEDGVAIFARDGAHCEALYRGCPLRGKILCGDTVDAGEIEVGPWGTRFLLTDRESGETCRCETRLLGRHNVDNLLLAASAAKALGMTLPEIARGIARCRPVEHRLQLLDAGGGITIIDDAFNANPAGAKAALEALSRFPGRRIVVTPGMVELGSREEELNREFGAEMAGSCDVAVLVGERHTRPIAEGLRGAGFDEGNLHVVASFDEAQNLLKGILRPGDTVLYENDLPDNYGN